MKKIVCLVVCFSVLFILSAHGQLRVWTLPGEEKTILGELTSISDDEKTVTVRTRDGEEHVVRVDDLSIKDQVFVGTQARKQKIEAEQPKEQDPQKATPATKTPTSKTSATVEARKQAAEEKKQERARVAQERARAIEEQKKGIYRKAIDFVNRNVKLELSDEEKEGVVSYLILADSAFQSAIATKGSGIRQGHNESDLNQLLLGLQHARNSEKIMIDAYVTCMVAQAVESGKAEAVKRRYDDMNTQELRDNKYYTRPPRLIDIEDISSVNYMYVEAYWDPKNRADVIKSLLPMCNRLSGNRYDAIEKEKTDTKRRQAAEEQERRQLFGR